MSDLNRTRETIQDLLNKAWVMRRNDEEDIYQKIHKLVSEAHGMVEVDDHITLGRIFHVYMQLEYDQERFEKALRLCRQSLSHYELAGNPLRIAHSTRHIADLQRHIGRLEEAEENYMKAISLYDEDHGADILDKANALRGMALLLEMMDRNIEAADAWLKARDLYEACHLPLGVEEANQRLKLMGF